MEKVKVKIPEKLRKGIPLGTGPKHTVRLEVTDEALTVHTGLSLFYAMAEALKIPRVLDKRVELKQRELGYPESEHILALAVNAFFLFGLGWSRGAFGSWIKQPRQWKLTRFWEGAISFDFLTAGAREDPQRSRTSCDVRIHIQDQRRGGKL